MLPTHRLLRILSLLSLCCFCAWLSAVAEVAETTILPRPSLPDLNNDVVETERDSSTTTTVSKNDTHIDPVVIRYPRVLPLEICRKIVELTDTTIFRLDREPVDDLEEDVGDQQINVLEEGKVVEENAKFYELLAPYVDTVTDLVKAQTDPKLEKLLFPNEEEEDRKPHLDSIFLRKYSAEGDSVRDSLSIHTDANTHTVNIALNEEFSGGGLFYIRPTLAENPGWLQRHRSSHGLLMSPRITEAKRSYDFVRKTKNQNTSDVVFPKQQTGDALIHNSTVWHAVSPIATGVRYSAIFFYDDEPGDFDDDDDDDDDDDYDDDDYDDAEIVDITFTHNIKRCNPVTGQLVPLKEPIDIFWFDDDDNTLENIISGLDSGVASGLGSTVVGNEFRAFRSLDRTHNRRPLATIVVTADQENYKFEGHFRTQDDCDGFVAFNKNSGEL